MNYSLTKKALIALIFHFLSVSTAYTQTAREWYEQGIRAYSSEQYYQASEAFLELLRINSSHADAAAMLAESRYALGEFDQALADTRRARFLSRENTNLANLEAAILIALGRLDEAETVLTGILAKEPNNRESLFILAELDLARGKGGDAALRYQSLLARHSDDRRALVSLALVLSSLGDREAADKTIGRALNLHPDSAEVQYHAALLDIDAGKFVQAADKLQRALRLKPGYIEVLAAQARVAWLRSDYELAISLCEQLVRVDRDQSEYWYLMALSQRALSRYTDALDSFKTALQVNPYDEFSRVSLEDMLIEQTNVEDASRKPWAEWHFTRAREFRAAYLSDQALFEYQRGLRLNPFSIARREYADLLGSMGYPDKQLSQLRFIQDQGMSDVLVNDTVEAWDSLLYDALHRVWSVDPLSIDSRHWKIAVMTLARGYSSAHVDAERTAATLLNDILVHDERIQVLSLPVVSSSFSDAWKAARSAGADYFLLIEAASDARDISLVANVYVGRTGSKAATFTAFRTGQDRLRNTIRAIQDQLRASLPLRARLLVRKSSKALIDIGTASGAQLEQEYAIVRSGAMHTANEGISLVWNEADMLGTLSLTKLGESVAEGNIKRHGFFDRIAVGDVLVVYPVQTPLLKTEPDRADPVLAERIRDLRVID